MAKSKIVEEVVEELFESTVVLNLPKEEPEYPGFGSRDFGKKEVTPEEVTPEEVTPEEVTPEEVPTT